MRICILTTAGHGLGGMQRHTHDLVRGLVAVDHEVDVICPIGETARDAYGARWLHVDTPGTFTDASWLRQSADAFERAHRERRYDVVHGEGSSGLGLVLRGLHQSVPLVEMFHSVFSGLARASLHRVVNKRTPLAVAREGRYLVRLSRKHFRRGNWYRFRPCEIIVPSYQQVRDTILRTWSRGTGFTSSATESTRDSGRPDPVRRVLGRSSLRVAASIATRASMSQSVRCPPSMPISCSLAPARSSSR